MAEIKNEEIIIPNFVNEFINKTTNFLQEKIPKGAINLTSTGDANLSKKIKDNYSDIRLRYLENAVKIFKIKYEDDSWCKKDTQAFNEFMQHRVNIATLLVQQFQAATCTEFAILAYDYLTKQNPPFAFSRVYLHDPQSPADILHEVILLNLNSQSLKAFSQKKYSECGSGLIIYDPWDDYNMLQAKNFDQYLTRLLDLHEPESYGLQIIQTFQPAVSLQNQLSTSSKQVEDDQLSINVMVRRNLLSEQQPDQGGGSDEQTVNNSIITSVRASK